MSKPKTWLVTYPCSQLNHVIEELTMDTPNPYRKTMNQNNSEAYTNKLRMRILMNKQ